MRWAQGALVILLVAGLGLTLFAFMARRAVTLEDASPSEALRRFEDVRASFGAEEPLVTLGAGGKPVRRAAPTEAGESKPRRLHVLVYRLREERLARAEIPFWFFRAKGPAAEFALRGTDFNLKQLGVTPGELERLGPRLVLDETRENGDRILIWTK